MVRGEKGLNTFTENKEYYQIIETYLNSDAVKKLDSIKHHNTTRLEHCQKVSYNSYKIAKKLGFDYESCAVGGLLHDLYFNLVENEKTIKDKVKLFTYGHPSDALKNAEKSFNLNELEKEIILTHMWPLSFFKVPKHKESVIVSLVDKGISIKEFGLLWSYKASYKLGVYFIFISNLILYR